MVNKMREDVAHITIRMPESLHLRCVRLARLAGLSLNSWMMAQCKFAADGHDAEINKDTTEG